MINKKGICEQCGEDSIITKPRLGLCFKCNRKRLDERKEKKSNRIKPISDKRVKQMAKYREERDLYLENNPKCECEDCNNPSTHIHHKAGRENDLLFMSEYFMAVCNKCHPRRIHETEVAWAKEKGYVLTVKIK
jgi:hypothetical protein